MRLSAPVPTHDMAREPNASIWLPTSYGPMRSSRSRSTSELRMTPPAMLCASLAMSPAMDATGTTITRMATRMTMPAASARGMRAASQRCSGANTM